MRKRNIKIFIGFALMAIVIVSIVNVSFASNFDFTRFDENSVDSADTVAQRAMGTAINIIRIVGTGTSIVMLTYMGIKYMMAAPSEKADFKKSAGIFVLGAVLIFAATNILGIIADFADKNL